MNWAIFKKLNSNFNAAINEHSYASKLAFQETWFTAASTWTVPEDGWYIITCVGKGGNGCPWKTVASYSTNVGGGGGGGAVTRGAYYLKKNTQYSITVGNPSAVGNLISAGAGADGTLDTGGAGGTCPIPGNIFAYNGIAGSGRTGGSAGAVTPWSIVQSGAGKGFLPVYNSELTGGARGAAGSTAGSAGKWGGGTGGSGTANSASPEPGAGGGGYGGGGQGGGKAAKRNGYTNWSIGNPGNGGAGVVIIEYGIELVGKN